MMPETEGTEECCDLDTGRGIEHRKAWLALGGFIAGADGLSAEEAEELGHSAAGSDLSKTEATAILLAGAAATGVPAASLAAVAESGILLKLECLLELAHNVAVDGMSASEWSRFCDVAAALVGAGKVDALLRLVLADREARRARRELVLGQP